MHLADWYHGVFKRRGSHAGYGTSKGAWHYDHKCSMAFCGWPDPKTRGEWLAESGLVKERRGILRQNYRWVLPPKPDGYVPTPDEVRNRLKWTGL